MIGPRRGRGPDDDVLFAPAALPALRAATDDLAWLLERGYADRAALALVGDRHNLRQRQRLAVARSAAAAPALAARLARRIPLAAVAGRPLVIDGFNGLIVVETALAGGVVLRGRDGLLRDLAGVHGSYRRADETDRAIAALGEVIAEAAPARTTWLLDRPVSHSGQLRARLETVAAARGWPWQVELLDAPDHALAHSPDVIATADAIVLDRCAAWVDLTGPAITRAAPRAWIVAP